MVSPSRKRGIAVRWTELKQSVAHLLSCTEDMCLKTNNNKTKSKNQVVSQLTLQTCRWALQTHLKSTWEYFNVFSFWLCLCARVCGYSACHDRLFERWRLKIGPCSQSLDLKPGGKKSNTNYNFPCQNKSCRVFFALPQSGFILLVLLEPSFFPWQQMFLWGRQKGCKPSSRLWTETAPTPTAPFVHISVTAERPRQSLRFPRPGPAFRIILLINK